MFTILRHVLLVCFFLNLMAAATPRDPNAAATPLPLQDEKSLARHEGFVTKAKLGGYELVMIGDSITDWWPRRGKETWQQLEAYKPLNLGWAGQHTEHILWRITHGEIDGLKPKLVTIMIGTNNLGHIGNETPESVAKGVAAIVAIAHEKMPTARILLFGIFPRGDKSTHPIRARIAATNQLIAKLADQKNVTYLDIGAKFLDAEGNLPKDVMPDFLHPNEAGYKIWLEAMKPTLSEIFSH